jgi:hypothetical protein
MEEAASFSRFVTLSVFYFLICTFHNLKTLKMINSNKVFYSMSFGLILCFFSCSEIQPTKSSPFFVSLNAHSLIDSYRDLVKPINTNDCDYDNSTNSEVLKVKGNRRYVASAMTAKGYAGGSAGYVTFISYHWVEYSFLNEPNKSIIGLTTPFRTAWLMPDDSISFGIRCVACLPKPVVFPYSKSPNVTNASFMTLLIPVSKYQASGLLISNTSNDSTGAAIDPLLSLAINSTEIKGINDVYMEEESGYMNSKLTAKYADEYSSIGVICDVVLKSGVTEKCYIFNNYDGAGTLVWKVKK